MNKKEAKITVLVVPPFGGSHVETIENTLAELQAHVGGYIEAFPVGIAGAIGICNEEGLLMRLPLGPVVPALGHPVCGTFLVVGDAGQEFGSLNAQQIAGARALFGGDEEGEKTAEFPLDAIFHYEGFFGCASQCRARIYGTASEAVVVLTETDENGGTSVTNAVDLLAVALCDAYGLDGGRAVWIEHSPDQRTREERALNIRVPLFEERFAQARFSHVERLGDGWGLRLPQWAPLGVAQVEELIGEEWTPEWD